MSFKYCKEDMPASLQDIGCTKFNSNCSRPSRGGLDMGRSFIIDVTPSAATLKCLDSNSPIATPAACCCRVEAYTLPSMFEAALARWYIVDITHCTCRPPNTWEYRFGLALQYTESAWQVASTGRPCRERAQQTSLAGTHQTPQWTHSRIWIASADCETP
jgi:hypothetical protein